MLEQEPTNGEGSAPAESAAPATEQSPAAPRKATKRAPRKSTRATKAQSATQEAPASEPSAGASSSEEAAPEETKPKRRTAKKVVSDEAAPPRKTTKRAAKSTQLTLSHSHAEAAPTPVETATPTLSAAPPTALFVAPQDVPEVPRKKQERPSHQVKTAESSKSEDHNKPTGPDSSETAGSDSDNDDSSRRRRRGRRGRGRSRDEGENTGDDRNESENQGANSRLDGSKSDSSRSDSSRSDNSKSDNSKSDNSRADNKRDSSPGEAGTNSDEKSGKDAGANSVQNSGRSDESSDDDHAGDDESSGTRRRRRRRRRGDDSDDDGGNNGRSVVSARSSDASKVRGVSGSVRLEAKRQRRKEGRDAGRRRAPILTEAEFLARRESVTRSMIVRQQGERIQIAVLEDDVLVEHYVTLASEQSFAGGIYYGRVQNVLPSMEAAFIDIGKKRNAVLYAGEVNWDAAGLEGKRRNIAQALGSGDKVLVQVTKDPIGHKGARLTSQISLPGRYLVYVPGGSMTGISRKLPEGERNRLKEILRTIVPDAAGVIVRTAAEGATEEELTRDVRRLQAQWEVIEKKVADKSTAAPSVLHEEPDLAIRVVRDLFNEDFESMVVSGADAWDAISSYLNQVAPDLSPRLSKYVGTGDLFVDHRVDEQLTKALDRKVWLPSGGSLVIDHTEAMTVVDVNTGKFTGSGGNLEQTVTKNNLEAAEEVVRQLRLRDVGGIVVIDFIDMLLESNRELVLRRLTECLGRDRTKHQVAEVTSLGLVQMTRKRVGQGLLDAFSEPCEHCGGRGVIVHSEPVDKDPGNDQDNSRGRGGGDKSRGRRDRSRGKGAESKPEPAVEPEPKHDASALISEIANATKRERHDGEGAPGAKPAQQSADASSADGQVSALQATAEPTVYPAEDMKPKLARSMDGAPEKKPTPRRRRAARRPAGSPQVSSD